MSQAAVLAIELLDRLVEDDESIAARFSQLPLGTIDDMKLDVHVLLQQTRKPAFRLVSTVLRERTVGLPAGQHLPLAEVLQDDDSQARHLCMKICRTLPFL